MRGRIGVAMAFIGLAFILICRGHSIVCLRAGLGPNWSFFLSISGCVSVFRSFVPLGTRTDRDTDTVIHPAAKEAVTSSHKEKCSELFTVSIDMNYFSFQFHVCQHFCFF